MVAETGWPVVCNTEAVPLSEPSIPVGVQGQITWIEDVVAVLNSVNHIHGNKALGIVYWEPGWTTNSALGSLCAVGAFPCLEPASFADTLYVWALGCPFGN